MGTLTACGYCGTEYDPDDYGRGWKFCNPLCASNSKRKVPVGQKAPPVAPRGRPARFPKLRPGWTTLIVDDVQAALERVPPGTPNWRLNQDPLHPYLITLNSMFHRVKLSIGGSKDATKGYVNAAIFYLDWNESKNLYVASTCKKQINYKRMLEPFVENRMQSKPNRRIACGDTQNCQSCRGATLVRQLLDIEELELVFPRG